MNGMEKKRLYSAALLWNQSIFPAVIYLVYWLELSFMPWKWKMVRLCLDSICPTRKNVSLLVLQQRSYIRKTYPLSLMKTMLRWGHMLFIVVLKTSHKYLVRGLQGVFLLLCLPRQIFQRADGQAIWPTSFKHAENSRYFIYVRDLFLYTHNYEKTTFLFCFWIVLFTMSTSPLFHRIIEL